MRSTKRYMAVSSLMFSLFLAACGTSQPPAAEKVLEANFIQLTSPGKARCLATSKSDNAAAAEITNIMRSKVGFAPVEPNPVLARVAAKRACDMAKRGQMIHIGSTISGSAAGAQEQGYLPLVTAENISTGTFSREFVLHEWNKRPDQLANILIPQIREFGIGEAIAADGKTRFWAAVYSVRR